MLFQLPTASIAVGAAAAASLPALAVVALTVVFH